MGRRGTAGAAPPVKELAQEGMADAKQPPQAPGRCLSPGEGMGTTATSVGVPSSSLGAPMRVLGHGDSTLSPNALSTRGHPVRPGVLAGVGKAG